MSRAHARPVYEFLIPGRAKYGDFCSAGTSAKPTMAAPLRRASGVSPRVLGAISASFLQRAFS